MPKYATITVYSPNKGAGKIKKFSDFPGSNHWYRFLNMMKVKTDYGHDLIESTFEKHSTTHLYDDGSWLHYVEHNSKELYESGILHV